MASRGAMSGQGPGHAAREHAVVRLGTMIGAINNEGRDPMG